MADVTVKLFGRYRLSAGWAARSVRADTLAELFRALPPVDELTPRTVLIYINGVKVHRLRTPLHDGDEVWLMGAASGG